VLDVDAGYYNSTDLAEKVIMKSLRGALSLALADSAAAADAFAKVFGNAAFGSISIAAVTLVGVSTFHPTTFAGCVFWQLLALEAHSFDVSVAFGFAFASAGSDKCTLVVFVATVQGLALVGGIGTLIVTCSLELFQFRGISGRAHLHHLLALPPGLGGASVSLIISAVYKC